MDINDKRLDKKISLKPRTLKPYEKKFIKPGELRYNYPIVTSIPKGSPSVIYTPKTKRELNSRQDLDEEQTHGSSQLPSTSNSLPLQDTSPDQIPCSQSGFFFQSEEDACAEPVKPFLGTCEHYFHLLKTEKSIAVFHDFGRIAVFPDYNLCNTKLQTETHHLVERRCVIFNGFSKSWIFWCSCNNVFARQISSLEMNLNTSYDDFMSQYPQCLHIEAAKMIFKLHDEANDCHLLDMDHIYDADHRYAMREEVVIYEVPNSNKICCASNDTGRFGLIYLKNSHFYCHCCSKFQCEHTSLMHQMKNSVHPGHNNYEIIQNFLSKSDEICNKKGYQWKCISWKKISFESSITLSENLRNIIDEKELILLLPDIDICQNCSSHLLEGDPVEENWVAYENATLITNTYIGFSKVYYRPCSTCDNISIFEGQSKGLLNLGTYLMGYDVLRSYMHSFLHGRRPLHTFYETWCDIHKDYGNTSVVQDVTYQRMRHAWISFLQLLDIDFHDGFSCPVCEGNDGSLPTTIICDGTSLSFQRRMWTFVEEHVENEEPMTLTSAKFSDRVYIDDLFVRKLLSRYAGGGHFFRGNKQKDLSQKEREILFGKLKELCQPLFKVLCEIDQNKNKLLPTYRNLLQSLSSPSPVSALIRPTKLVYNIISEILKGTDVRTNPLLWESIHQELPLFFQIFEKFGVPHSIRPLLEDLWLKSIELYSNSAPAENTCKSIQNDDELSFFPSLPKLKNRGVFLVDKTKGKDDEFCTKKYRGHPSLLPGIFTIFCPHGICYGFQVMQTNESVNIPFTILRTRFKKAPRCVIYDNACKLHVYCLMRDPLFFQETQFYVDRLHWDNHSSCSMAYELSQYPQHNSLNSQCNEQANAGLKRIKDQLSYMTANNFMMHCSFYLWNKNRKKIQEMT